MNFKDVVKKRYSMRQFKPDEVVEEKIRELVDIAKLAPSAGNLQSYQVIITKEKVTSYGAPLYLVVCADQEKSASRYGDRGRNLYSIQDATIFAAYLQLAIVDAGLASCWVGAFREGRLKRQLNIPDNLKPITIICIGFPPGRLPAQKLQPGGNLRVGDPAIKKSGRNRRKFEDIILSEK